MFEVDLRSGGGGSGEVPVLDIPGGDLLPLSSLPTSTVAGVILLQYLRLGSLRFDLEGRSNLFTSSLTLIPHLLGF